MIYFWSISWDNDWRDSTIFIGRLVYGIVQMLLILIAFNVNLRSWYSRCVTVDVVAICADVAVAAAIAVVVIVAGAAVAG